MSTFTRGCISSIPSSSGSTKGCCICVCVWGGGGYVWVRRRVWGKENTYMYLKLQQRTTHYITADSGRIKMDKYRRMYA